MRDRGTRRTSTCRVALLFWKGLGHRGMNMYLSSALTCMCQELVGTFKGLINPQGKVAYKDSSGLT